MDWPSWSFLAPDQQSKALWAGFDPELYSRRYPEAANDPLAFYLAKGAELGHSPNIFFDESWYVSRYQEVAAAIKNKQVRSGFEHYCRFGLHRLSPHWLFDHNLYKTACKTVDSAALARGGFVNLYDHYLQVGSKEGRSGHSLFWPDMYRRNMKKRKREADVDRHGPFVDFLYWMETQSAEVPVSIYFDHEWYLSTYPKVVELIGKGRFRCALHHYLCNDSPAAFDPLCDFSESYYLERYPDIKAAMEAGRLRNGYAHFLQHGAIERRNPAPHIDLRYYWSRNGSIGLGLDPPSTPNAFAHLLTIGAAKGLLTAPPSKPADVPEDLSRALFLARAQNLLPLFAKRPIDFRHSGQPALSVIMIIHGHLAMSLMALASLRDDYDGDIELILVDSGSSDETTHIERFVRGATLLRFDANVGFVRGCNAALEYVTAPYVLFLNNDVQLASGAVAAALERIETRPRNIGAVGAKVIRTNEKLQEAGCIIWRDGSTAGYLRDRPPSAPEANFVRDVDFCSGVFLLVRADVLKRLGGFDPALAPAYFEDADLCLRIWQTGYRVVYEPNAVVHHYESGSARHAHAAVAQMRLSHKIFARKQSRALKRHALPSQDAVPTARFAAYGAPRTKILYIEDAVPLPTLGSGFVRSNDLIRVMAGMGYLVTVFPMNGGSLPSSLAFGEFPDDVEVMHDATHQDLQKFLAARPGYFDCIWICRAHNLERIAPLLAQTTLIPASTRVILDTEALFSVREALQAERENRTFDLERAIAKELKHARSCHEIVVVSEQEAETLRGFGYADVQVVGTIRNVNLTRRSWKDRAGLLFVGSLRTPPTPNFDSLCWFVDEVLPLIENELGWETRLTFVGYVGDNVPFHRFANHPRITWIGPADDLWPIYDAHRIVIAPTRYAAGTPYKVYEAASFGVPVVASELLCRQLGWEPEVEILSAATGDAAAFAAQVVRLYRSESLWRALRDAAAERLSLDNSYAAYVEALGRILPGRPHSSWSQPSALDDGRILALASSREAISL